MTGKEVVKIGGLLLAAGGSSRFGSPKQLALFEGKTLLRRAAEALANSSCEPVAVVLGAETELSRFEVADLSVNICINENWRAGMSSSIKYGLTELTNIEPDLAAVMIMLCDQPYVTTDKIGIFTAKFRQTNSPVIAAEYDGIKGVPALFARSMFDQLLNLKGDKGARELIRNRDNVFVIKMDSAAFDLDTSDDLYAVTKIEP